MLYPTNPLVRRTWNPAASALALAVAFPLTASAQEAIVIADGQVVTETIALPNDGDSLTIEENGIVTTDGDFEPGVDVSGADVTVTNDGTIETAGFDADGILAGGPNGKIVNTGTITTTGEEAEGIFSEGDRVTAVNEGTITTFGDDGDGIDLKGANSTLNNSGTITTNEVDAEGLFSDGADSIVENNGDVTTNGDRAEAMFLRGDRVVATNRGRLIANGDSSEGVQIEGDEARFTNEGTILTYGEFSEAIDVDGDFAEIHNSGLVETFGASSEAIEVDGDDAIVTNTGVMATNADSVDVVNLDGNNITFINSGSILANGAGSEAIDGDGGTQTVILNEGSRVLGAIDLGGGDTVLNINANMSSTLDLANIGTLNVAEGLAFVELDGRSALVDTTGHAALNDATAALASNLHRSIQTNGGGASGAWASVFGASRDVDGTDIHLGYGHDFAGGIAGYDYAVGQSRVGVVGGAATGSVETDIQSYDTDIESLFAGAYIEHQAGAFDLTGSVILGTESIDMTRFVFDSVDGLQEAGGAFDGQFASVSLGAAGPVVSLGGVNLRPSAIATYTTSRYDAFTEDGEGATAITFDERDTQDLRLRAQLEALQTYGDLQMSLRAGIDAQYREADDISGTLGEETFAVSAFEEDNVIGGFVGAQALLAERGNMSFLGDVEYQFADDVSDSLSAGLNVSFRF